MAQVSGLSAMEIVEISKMMQQADSQAVTVLIAAVQVGGALGRGVLQNGRRMGREQGPGSTLIEHVSTTHPFCVDGSP